MKKYTTALLFCLAAQFLSFAAAGTAAPGTLTKPGPNLLANPGFEAGLTTGWRPLWTREPNVGTEEIDTAAYGGTAALRVRTSGTADWSVDQAAPVTVRPGDIVSYSGWIKGEGSEVAQLSVATCGADGSMLNWVAEQEEVGGTHDWQRLTHRWVVPAGVATIRFRLTGFGTGTVWLDDTTLVKEGSTADFRVKLPGRAMTLTNAALGVRLNTADGTLTVTDKRGGTVWHQQTPDTGLIVKAARQMGPRQAVLTVWDVVENLTLGETLTLDPRRPEMTVRLTGTGPLHQSIAYPPPFVSGAGTWLILPMNEGLLYPVDDSTIPPITLTTYSGHGLCMPWFGAVSPATGAGVQTLVRTPDDAHVDFTRQPGGRLYAQPAWEASRGAFAYPRVLTYVFSAKGGYVAQAKRYRAYAQATGLFKTLAQKRRSNPNIDLLVGAVNVWNWDMDKVALCREMKSLGMDHVLWSSGGTPQEVAQINSLGYLSSRYDIFQDVWGPDAPAWLHHDGWPEDLVKLPGGGMMLGWADREKQPDGTEVVYQGGVVNSQRGLARARRTIPADLKSTPYLCRFIDTTTASPWREDYDPAHPLTRTQDRAAKMALLGFCADTLHQVVGTETGIDPSVPYADYYEGMLSLGPYRLPDAGYTMLAYKTPTPDFLKFQVGSFYRLPLWELVYHDCVVAGWYWGDSTNKAPEVWPRRDLFNILYATPPLFLFDRAIWEKNRAHFAQTYHDVCPVVRRLGYAEMLSHEFLTPDHSVQRTRWSSGTSTTVNFGTAPYRLSTGALLAPGGWQVR